MRSKISYLEGDLSLIQTKFDFLKTQISKIYDETSLANEFIQGFTQEELTCKSLGDNWQQNVVESICGDSDEDGTTSMAQNSANLLITLFILMFVEMLLVMRGFVLSVKNYKHASDSYLLNQANAKDDNFDTATVDEAHDLENDQDLQESLIDTDDPKDKS